MIRSRVLCTVPAGFVDSEPYVRKLSTASLSHIEGELTRGSTRSSAALHAISSSHNLSSSRDTWYIDVDQQARDAAHSDGVVSPVSNASTKSTGKFFVFGGTRSARKQRQVSHRRHL